MRHRPIPDVWKREMAQQHESAALEIVRDELARVRREIARQEGMAVGLQRALAITQMSEEQLAEAVRRLA